MKSLPQEKRIPESFSRHTPKGDYSAFSWDGILNETPLKPRDFTLVETKPSMKPRANRQWVLALTIASMLAAAVGVSDVDAVFDPYSY